MTTQASAALEAWIDKSNKVSAKHGYDPYRFIRMRHELGTIRAIETLVGKGEVKSGFTRLKNLGLLRWSLENCVITFPEEFSHTARICAGFLLREAGYRVQEEV